MLFAWLPPGYLPRAALIAVLPGARPLRTILSPLRGYTIDYSLTLRRIQRRLPRPSSSVLAHIDRRSLSTKTAGIESPSRLASTAVTPHQNSALKLASARRRPLPGHQGRHPWPVCIAFANASIVHAPPRPAARRRHGPPLTATG
jgi:hypothetical protein